MKYDKPVLAVLPIMTVLKYENTSATKMVKFLDLSLPYIFRTIAFLKAEKLITFLDSSNKRTNMCVLTEEGKILADSCENILKKFSPETHQIILTKIAQKIETEINEPVI